VSGADLVPGDDWGNLIYMTLCMDQGSGDTLQVHIEQLKLSKQSAKGGVDLIYMTLCADQATGSTLQVCGGASSTWRTPAVPVRSNDCSGCVSAVSAYLSSTLLRVHASSQGSEDPSKAGEAWMLKMSEWAPQSLGGALAAGEALDPKGGPATQKITRSPLAVLIRQPSGLLVTQ